MRRIFRRWWCIVVHRYAFLIWHRGLQRWVTVCLSCREVWP